MLIGQRMEPRTRTKMLTFLEERAEIEKVFSLLTLQQ